MSPSTAVILAYGLFCVIGGIIGYTKAKSTASLIAGSVSGIMLLVSAYGMGQGNSLARVAVILIALILGARFLRTWLKTRRLMPDLLMILFSLATLMSVIFR